MLENVLGQYLESLANKEREFDAPFIALLRSNGYTDIHFTHGQFEFGKDFIAKGYDEDQIWCQFVFQTKGGDIGTPDWRTIRGQIDELRTDPLSHPSFNLDLPRRAVLVTTGRLVGGATLASQNYKQHLKKLNEIGFILWDKEDLISLMLHSLEIGLAGTSNGHLLQIIGQIDRGFVTWKELEEFSRTWIANAESVSTLLKASIEASLIANKLRVANRQDLACFTGLALIRAAWASTHGIEPLNKTSIAVDDIGKRIFKFYALSIWEKCTTDTLDTHKFNSAKENFALYVTGSVRCSTLIEILGLLGLLENESNSKLATEIGNYLKLFFEAHSYATQPISDKWAVSLIPPLLLLVMQGFKAEVESILRKVVFKSCNHYENGNLGLADPHSEIQEEIDYFLGSPLEHIPLKKRSESYILTVVLDLAAIFENESLYNAVMNEFLAVNANVYIFEAGDTIGQYMFGGEVRYSPVNTYRETWNPQENWKVAAHHYRNDGEHYFLTRNFKLWQQIILSSVLRDRHFVYSCRAIISSSLRAIK